MADILIRMEMPRNCFECPLFSNCDACEGHECGCGLLGGIGYEEDISEDRRRDDCPLIELPEHGDLIDRDVLLAEYERDERAADEHGREFSFSFDSGGARCTEWWIVQQKLMDTHAIVPANKEETENGL